MMIGTIGLLDDQIATAGANLPVKDCEVIAADYFSDIVAANTMPETAKAGTEKTGAALTDTSSHFSETSKEAILKIF